MRKTRREFVKTTVAAAGGLAIGSQSVVANGIIEDQYLVDTRSVDSETWRENVEIIDETDEIGFASVKASEEDLENVDGLRFGPEVEYEIAPPSRPADAPAETSEGASVEADAVSSDVSTTPDGIPEPHPYQWDKKAQGIHDIHQEGITGDGATVAIVDSGIDTDHPDLSGKVVYAENFSAADDVGTAGGEYHGTHVAGTVGATGANASSGDYWAVGTAPDADLMDLKIFPFNASASILSAIETAINEGADVVNMSFGPGSPAGPTVDTHLSQEAYRRVGDFAVENDALLVESSGNSDSNIDDFTGTLTNAGEGPHPGYLKVSATGPGTSEESLGSMDFGDVAPTTAPAYYTNHGPETIDISAAGGNSLFTNYDAVFSTMPPGVSGGFVRDGDGEYGEYGNIHGTSMAAPNVAGAAALLFAENPNATTHQIRNHLKNTAATIEEEPPDIFEIGGVANGYFEDTNGTVFNDFELEEPYSSEMYRGDGHLDVSTAVSKGIPNAIEGGVEVMGETYYPLDPDGDGRYEDVNGDGVVDMDDVELLYQIALRNAVGSTTTAFDFNGDGSFDMYDVQALVREVQE